MLTKIATIALAVLALVALLGRAFGRAAGRPTERRGLSLRRRRTRPIEDLEACPRCGAYRKISQPCDCAAPKQP